ncbi:hypothetical protein [Nocardia wallacei]|uniref:hypothetical protein n=1 Tax=Nocardia wallacei TaxID=480035 RepID=UPI0024565E9B|nr:hypothetical protein [Nocardia wallacei]
MTGGSPPIPMRPPPMKMTAETPEEFLALLRSILKWSGLTASQVAVSSQIPRSTCYHFVNPANTKLPKYRDQVEKFARGCRLNDFHVAQVVKLWDKLQHGDASVALAEPPPPEPPEPELPEVDERRKEAILRMTDLVDVITDRPLPESGSEAWLRVTEDPVRGTRRDLYLVSRKKPLTPAQLASAAQITQPDLPVVDTPPPEPREGDTTAPISPARCKRRESRRLEFRRRYRMVPAYTRLAEFRRCVLLLLALAIYPVAAVTMFGVEAVKPVVMMGIILLLVALHIAAPWLSRSPSLRSPIHLVTITVMAIAAACLAFYAIPSAAISALTAVLTFVATPLWLDAVTLIGLFTSSRGVFAFLAAVGCSAVTGFLVSTAGGVVLVATAILTALVTYAVVLMELSIRLAQQHDPPPSPHD